MNNPNAIDILKLGVERKFGRVLASPSDYDILSVTIYEYQNDRISSSTLKRIFGYIESESKPSRSSLNILARYVGYYDWQDFVEKQQDTSVDAQSLNYDDKAPDNVEEIEEQVIDNPPVSSSPVDVSASSAFQRSKKWILLLAVISVIALAFAYSFGRYQESEALKDIKTSQLARPKDMNNPKNVELFRRGDLLYRRWFKSPYFVSVECVNKDVTTVTIPDSVVYRDTTYHVAELSFDCFKDCKHLKTVILEGGNRHLQNGVFKGCDELKVISIKSNWPPSIGNGGWPASVPEIFDEHHFEDVTLYLTPMLYEELHKFPAWGDFVHKEIRNPAPDKNDKGLNS